MEARTIEPMRLKYRGVMVGAAVGDALGAEYEFQSAEVIAHQVRGLFVRSYPEREGFPTDDTQLSILVAQALVEAETFNLVPARLARALGAWHTNPMGGHRAPGMACMRAARELARDPDSWITNRYPEALGCGAIMRAHPVALRLFGSSARITRAVAGQANLTHGHPLSTAACEMWAVLIYEGLVGTLTGPDRIRDCLRSIADTEEKRSLIDALRGDVTAANLASLYVEHPGWRADDAFVAAVGSVMAHGFGATPFDAVARSVVMDGDSDSVASMVGALVGAIHGIEAFPKPLVARLEWFWLLSELADKLYEANLADGGIW